MKHHISLDLMSKEKQDIAFNNLLAYISKVGSDLKKQKMSKTLRAKFSVEHVVDYGEASKGYPNKRVKLNAVYSGDRNIEDNQFSMATPWGTLEMMISNPNAIDFFTPGKKYYLDFTEAEE